MWKIWNCIFEISCMEQFAFYHNLVYSTGRFSWKGSALFWEFSKKLNSKNCLVCESLILFWIVSSFSQCWKWIAILIWPEKSVSVLGNHLKTYYVWEYTHLMHSSLFFFSHPPPTQPIFCNNNILTTVSYSTKEHILKS